MEESKLENNRKPGKPKGSPKSGGRAGGTPNGITVERKKLLDQEFRNEGFIITKEIVEAFKVNDYERLDRLIKLLDYLYPKIAAKLSLDENLSAAIDDINLNIKLNSF